MLEMTPLYDILTKKQKILSSAIGVIAVYGNSKKARYISFLGRFFII
jgi:hypothetical protein